ncbi:helix-turn-helix domain-containing protein [Actinomadura madurae]|uniref:helix-turn-helix domain-containing protein n=1 Tax=Actinomadura madurae TaxID=1993 RepID=UPI000D8FB7C5|nr:helix-turn-helix domain-containing protein [Actinomadura madurae]SPT52308.1 Transcriptional activator feaR [Actinomadura madurae]
MTMNPGPVSGPERWDVRPGRGARTARAWVDALTETHGAFEVRLPDDDAFTGSVVRHRLGTMDVVECRSTPFAGFRAADPADEPGEQRIGVQMLLRGVERITGPHAGNHVLTEGGLDLWDGTRPARLEVVEPFAKRTLIFSRRVVLGACPRLADVAAVPDLGRLPGARLLARYADAVVTELPGMDARMRATACDVALELLRSLVEPALPDTRAARREALRARARRYIRIHLADPRLGPDAVARALSVSLRTLHSAFEGSGETVASLVRRGRLARCREDLADPESGSITEIAFRWGFTDATHFSQAFKREYGMPPREARALSTRQPRAEPMV